MPTNLASKAPLPVKVLAQQFISVSRVHESDFAFTTSIVTEPGTPVFNVYNTRQSSKQGHTICPRSKSTSDWHVTSMLTAIVGAQYLTNMTGQVYRIFTNAISHSSQHMTWVYPDHFQYFISRLGWHVRTDELCWISWYINGRLWIRDNPTSSI